MKRSKQLSIIVAQRVSTVVDADQIIVLDNGEIAGIGTHKELLRNIMTCIVKSLNHSSQRRKSHE